MPDHAFTPIAGQPPLLTDLPPGCSFAPRCERVAPVRAERPSLSDDDHAAACHNPC
ncbi:hypothetical protein [Actinophytocola xanthii]|uniref:hypothetical protein n=1 Tax=Actinophytocola xanthii TaxID=1912961 RepID=UPI0038B86914